MNQIKKNRTKKKFNPNKTVCVYLDEMTLAKLKLIGSGNVSEGIRLLASKENQSPN